MTEPWYCRPHDLLRDGDRFWEVEACCLGATGSEDGIILRPIGKAPAHDDDGFPTRLVVPLRLLQAAIRGGARHYIVPAAIRSERSDPGRGE